MASGQADGRRLVLDELAGANDGLNTLVPWRNDDYRRLRPTLATFRSRLIAMGEWRSTLIVTYSEFGRRAAENASGGTDHGTAAPHLVLGGRINGGLYGDAPNFAGALGANDAFLASHVDRRLDRLVGSAWGHPGTQAISSSEIPALAIYLPGGVLYNPHMRDHTVWLP